MNKNNSSGLGIMAVLQIIFIVLKVLKLINWNWWIVFIPTFIDLGILIIAFLILGILDYFSRK